MSEESAFPELLARELLANDLQHMSHNQERDVQEALYTLAECRQKLKEALQSINTNRGAIANAGYALEACEETLEEAMADLRKHGGY